MSIKIEEGKSYLTANGNITGSMYFRSWEDGFCFTSGKDMNYWNIHGKAQVGSPHNDLVSEALDTTSPVRTRTVTEIVPDQYGIVSVKESHPRYENSVNICIQPTHATSQQLRAAIATLTAIADALEESK